jgi:hypothetical protein
MNTSFAAVRHAIERLSPYQSLGLLAVPVCLIEPLKLVAVAVAGEGHWITGTAVIIAAYLGSVLVVEQLFRIAKPQLLMLPWFRKLWDRFLSLRDKAIGWITPHPLK